MILDYNKHMGGVDKMDQSRAYYGIGRKALKYWKCILYNIFNIALINSFIVYKKNNLHLTKKYNLLAYKNDLRAEMMDLYSSRSRPSNEPIPSTDNHKLLHGTSRVCVHCKRLGMKTLTGNTIRTSFFCNLCDVPLCKNCHPIYHNFNL